MSEMRKKCGIDMRLQVGRPTPRSIGSAQRRSTICPSGRDTIDDRRSERSFCNDLVMSEELMGDPETRHRSYEVSLTHGT